MFRDDSPDYSAPTQRWFTPPPSDPSPRYSPPRNSLRSPSGSPSPSSPRQGSSRRSRSRSPVSWSSTKSRRDRSRSRSQGQSRRRFRNRSRSRSRDEFKRESPSQAREGGRRNDLSAEDEETLRSLHCKKCEVTLHDEDSMMAHIKGKPHLAQLKRLQDRMIRERTGLGISDVLTPDCEIYDEKYWDREKGARRLLPEQERFLDTKRLNNVKAKFNAKNYDNGQYRCNEKELYCETCDVWVRSRDQMQAHKDGANHKKMSAKVAVYECKLCFIKVPCQDTLNNHMRGKDHIKRAKQLEEKRRQRNEVTDDSEKGYQIGPMEMLKLGDDEMEELKRLRLENEILKKKVAQYKVERETCVREHGELEELRRRVRDLEREKEDRIKFTSYVMTEKVDRNRSTSYVKTETVSKVKKEEPGEYIESGGVKQEEILID